MGEETVNAQNVDKGESGQAAGLSEKVFKLEILPMIKHAQQQHGLRHGDYQRYRGYCTRRIRRLRKALKFPQGDKRHFKRRDVTLSQLSGKRADERYALIPLMCAERAWAYAMQLKQEANTEPRKRFHLIHKLRKACIYTLQLQELVKSDVFDARSKLECEAYVSWIHGSLHFELHLWQSSGEHLKRAQIVYGQLANALPEDEQELYRSKVNEFLPNLRYCAYNIGESGTEDELLSMRAEGVLDNIEMLVRQTKLSTNEALQTFEWNGHKIHVRNEKVRLFLLSSEELNKTLEKTTDLAERIKLIERLLDDCKEAIQAVREDIRTDAKLRSTAATGQSLPAGIQKLKSYLFYLRSKYTLLRNLCLVEQAKQNFVDPNKKELEKSMADKKETKSKLKKEAKSSDHGTNTLTGKRVRSQDLARLYEIILQNVNELQQNSGLEDQSEIKTWATAFKAFRCYYIAITLNDVKRWREAVALYERASKYAKEALQQFKQIGTDEFKLSESLSQLVRTIESSQFQAHAQSVLELRSIPSASTLPNLSKTISQKPTTPLYERLNEYKEDPSLNTKQPNVFKLMPELEAVPCKPLFFDLSLNYVEMPSLEDKLESPKKSAAPGTGISGFVKGFLGWGSNK